MQYIQVNVQGTELKQGVQNMANKQQKKPSARAIQKIHEVSEEIADIWNGFDSDTVNTDVLGSYTGTPTDKTENPVQDADDL